MTTRKQVVPVPGMGATIGHHSDCDPATISRVAVFKSGARVGQVRAVWVRRDDWVITSGSEVDGSAKYDYTRNPNAGEIEFRADKNGRFVRKGGGDRLGVGHRRRYYDPHF